VGVLDSAGQIYFSNPVYFADAFNFLLYGGERVIDPGRLRELDTTEVTAVNGGNAKANVQKTRDLLRMWGAMEDDNAVYVMLGLELQGLVHYAMPVRSALYDAIGYANQVSNIARSYRKDAREKEEADVTVENGTVKIKLTDAEFLSGLRKGDKLVPIVTAVVHLGDKPWDGPRSLLDMLDLPDGRLRRFLNDYRLNLISPAEMDEGEFDKFGTDLGDALRFCKHRSSDLDKLIQSKQGGWTVDRETARFLNAAINLKIDYEEERGGVNMSNAIERRYKEKEVTGAIDAYRDAGFSDEEIIERVTMRLDVDREYVLALLAQKQE
jgi:hypothetical protein